jgi:hypothetical protein
MFPRLELIEEPLNTVEVYNSYWQDGLIWHGVLRLEPLGWFTNRIGGQKVSGRPARLPKTRF